jgi:lysophospholipase L1-like esterase
MADPSDNGTPSSAPARVRSSPLRTFWGYLLPTIAFLLIVEGIFRMVSHRDANDTLSGFVELDSELVWRLKPISSGPLATNELGLRDGPYRADADVKVLLLGDSVSWGDSVLRRERLFSSLMEKMLADLEPEKSFEVINSGVPGYSTFQEKRYLELHGDELDPDLVILQFCLNDVVERYRALAGYGGDNVFLGVDTREAVKGIHGALLRNSRAYEHAIRWAQQRSRKRHLYSVTQLARDDLPPELEAAWSLTLGEVDGIHEWASKRGIPALLVITPYRFQLENPQETGQPQERLVTHAINQKMAVLDLLPDFADGSRVQSAALFLDENHLSPAGHELTAHLLTAKTRELLRDARR